MLDAIYHPHYMPNINWYKSQLLVWDKIYRIVPNSVEKKFGACALASQWDISEEYFNTIPVSIPDKDYFNNRKSTIQLQLLELSKRKINSFLDEEHFYLNSEKIPKWLGEYLLELGLRKKNIHQIWESEHYLVRKDASDILMSWLAHSMSHVRAMFPLTNVSSSYYSIYANQIGEKTRYSAGESMNDLVTGIFNIMIPSDLSSLSFKDVIFLREEFTSLREALARTIKNLSYEFSLNRFIEINRAKELLDEALNKFSNDIERFKKQTFWRTVADWKMAALATSILTGGAFLAGGPKEALLCAGVGGVLTLLNNLGGKVEPNDIQKGIQYFCNINEKLEIEELINGLKKCKSKYWISIR